MSDNKQPTDKKLADLRPKPLRNSRAAPIKGGGKIGGGHTGHDDTEESPGIGR